MTNNTPASYFERAKAIQGMILAAQEDLRQLREDAIAELIDDSTSKEAAKEIRKDLAEVFAVAKIAAKGDIEERNQAAKMARRKRIAEECGVQLELLPDVPAEPARRMARAAANSPRAEMMARMAEEAGVSADVKDLAVRTAQLSETNPLGANAIIATVKALAAEGRGAIERAAKQGGGVAFPPHDPETGEVLDDDEHQPAATSDEPAVTLAAIPENATLN